MIPHSKHWLKSSSEERVQDPLLWMTFTQSALSVEMAGQLVTLVYIEIKREAGHSGDAQQAGMAYLLQDCASEKFMSSSPTLRPALLVMAWQSST
ncbi:hypothetical protein WJX77_005080 [Trebouxia sp. C0004]